MIKRKKTLVKLLAAAMCMELLSVPASSVYAAENSSAEAVNIGEDKMHPSKYHYAVDSNGIKWSYQINYEKNITISLSEKPDKTDIEVPKTLDGHTVVAISNAAFCNEGNELTSIKIPSTVTSIGYYAFNSCSKLKDIDIPSSVKEIGPNAFDLTPFLAKKQSESPLVIINNILVDGKAATGDITIPDNVTQIGDAAFTRTSVAYVDSSKQNYNDYSKITSVTIPSSVKSVGSSAFYRCPELKKVTIKGNTKVFDNAFADCEKLSEADLPSSLDVGNAFKNTPWINSIYNSSDDLKIVNGTLVDGTNAEGKVVIPSNVTIIDENAFKDNDEITSITIPSSVKEIRSFAFSGCKNLKSADLTSDVKVISSYAFHGCPKLEKVILPENLVTIGKCAFEDSALTSLNLPEKQLQVIEENAFRGCKKLTSLNIPATVSDIGVGAFSYCEGVKNITFSGETQLKTISSSVFEYCTSLEEFEIPKGVTEMGSAPFYGCTSLKTLKVPSTVTYMPDNAFAECSSLATVYTEGGYGSEYFAGKNVEIKSYNSSSNNNNNNNNNNNGNAGQGTNNSSSSDQGWKSENNNWYYRDSKGNNYTGWLNINGGTYYFYGDGTMATSFVNLGDSFFYFDPSAGSNQGNLVTGWQKVNGCWYYFSPQADKLGNRGTMQTGWFYNNGTWYYFYTEGVMATGFVDLGDGAVYYLYPGADSSEGAMLTGWQRINGYWYYFNPVTDSNGYQGMMQRGWRYIDGVWYYMYSDGKMAANTWIDNYYVNGSGAWVSTR